MLILRFFHDENVLTVGEKKYNASCAVRNELNGERDNKSLPKTYPASGQIRKSYQPRKFPTGLWKIKKPIWTTEIDYAPVKIPTDAVRRVITEDGSIQDDAFYHLHFAKESKTTLGCIRLDRAEDAIEIANTIIDYMDHNKEVYIEVIASRECRRG